MGLVVQEREGLVSRFDALEQREVEALADEMSLRGFVHAVLRNGDGEISFESIMSNLVTRTGNQYYGERASGIGSPPNQATGMRLGTGTGAVAGTGAGSFNTAHISGSQTAGFSSGPTSSIPSGSIRRITWVGSWAAGVATNAAISEAVITNETPITNVVGVEANTLSRVLLSPTINKGASDTLTLTWQHDLGA